jgi:hypothetical protein
VPHFQVPHPAAGLRITGDVYKGMGNLSAPGVTAVRQAVFPRRRGGAEGVYKVTGSLGVPRWAADRFPDVYKGTGNLSAPGFTAVRQAVFPRRRGGAGGFKK